jgi:uncharacterized membrane protein HdeD (DUF308 family)
MSANSFVEGLFHDRLKAASGSLFWLGLATLVLGIVALVFPVVSTLAATLFVGWILLISGVFALAGSFSISGTGPFFGALLLALLSIAAGVLLLLNPVGGEITLTLIVGALFMVQGAFEMVFAFELRPVRGWWAMLFSSIASIAVALIIVASWPRISIIALGVLLGVNFISTGLGYMFLSRALKP